MTTTQPTERTDTAVRSTLFPDLITMARRDLMRVMRSPEALSFSLTMGIFFLLLFYYVFGGVIEAGAKIEYIQFLVPGVLVITALNGSTQTGAGLALDLSEGVTDRFRSLPMSQLAVVAGRTVADGIRNLIGLVLLAAFGLHPRIPIRFIGRRDRRSGSCRTDRIRLLLDQRSNRRQGPER